ncbi:MAG: iron-sulfur cluster assembly accessory protein [Gammaproteobacteria bacterium]|nr:iron-sulfur cluster assembly accessory protein [Gammaproteobacteria bacterium]
MLTLTDNAIQAIDRFIKGADSPIAGLRISVQGGGCSGFQYGMSLEEASDLTDTVVTFGAVKVFIDPQSAPMLQGVKVDFVDGLEGSGFKFENPNATNSCGCGNSFSV